MDKLIFNKPLCNTHACCNNDPNYPNNCSIMSAVECCCIAEIQYPNYLQRALAWLDRHWLRLAIAGLAASLLICWSLFAAGLGATAAIDDLRAEYMQICMRHK